MVEPDTAPRRRLFDVNSRLSKIDKRLNSISDELQIVRSDTIDKHREVLKQVSRAKEEVANIGREVLEVKKLADGMTSMLGEFASKDSVKVLEKYINLWKPIDYVTREDVATMIAEAKASKRGSKKQHNKKRTAATKSKK